MRIFLAPMEGVVDHHLRYLLSRIGGIDICVTEFIRVSQDILPERVFLRYCPELAAQAQPPTEPGPPTESGLPAVTGPGAAAGTRYGALCPTRVQLLGCDPALLASNARVAVKLGAPAIDLNFGCPAKTVNKNRGGACLLKEPNLLFDIVSAVREAVPADIPVTAKIRLGFEEREGYLDTAAAIARAGANELVVHARSKSDGYKPPAYWACVGHIREAISIPVIANGEIWSPEDYLRCVALSGCEDIMLGRGLLARPDLALAIKAQIEGKEFTAFSWTMIAQLLLEFFGMTGRAYHQKYTGNRVKQWLFYLSRQYPEAKTLFEHIKRDTEFSTIERKIALHAFADAHTLLAPGLATSAYLTSAAAP